MGQTALLPGLGFHLTRSQGLSIALSLIAAVPTGTATHIPPASTQLMCLKPQEA